MNNQREMNEIFKDCQIAVQGLAEYSKEVKESVVHISSRDELRFLVDTYYQAQDARIAADGRIRSIIQGADDQGEKIPASLQWISANQRNTEQQVKKLLLQFTKTQPVGQWCNSILGIGPVLSAGCLAHFDITVCAHYNQFWSFCGLNDYNNPWLGKEASKKMVKKIYEELEAEDADALVHCDIEISDSDKKKMGRAVKNVSYYGEEDIFDTLNTVLTGCDDYVEELLNYFEGNEDRVKDLLVRHFVSSNAVTEQVITRVMGATGRRREIIIKGLNNMIIEVGKNKETGRVDKKIPSCILYKRSDLESYLAKPPYSQSAKQLVYLIGESFVKVSKRDKSLYGKIYRERKSQMEIDNENGKFAELAEKCLAAKNYGKETDSYKAYITGKLPQIQIHRRAKRAAVALFVSHLFEAMYMDYHKRPMDFEIYPIAFLGHTDYIGPEVPFENFIKI